ncbi:hypothetical protein ACE1ET_13325 [Saccharicrinis sp. FJH62]|uniref:hypothetical protein n=1 Tax=Saccharicrinis sp. FJH62 TaxID=3344657 RepID=UPI0035D4A1E2
MKKNSENLDVLFKNYDRDFKPFFETRLKARFEKDNKEARYEMVYNRFFKRIVYSGFIAIAAILLALFVMNGSLGVDSLIGVKDLSVENSLVLSLADL